MAKKKDKEFRLALFNLGRGNKLTVGKSGFKKEFRPNRMDKVFINLGLITPPKDKKSKKSKKKSKKNDVSKCAKKDLQFRTIGGKKVPFCNKK